MSKKDVNNIYDNPQFLAVRKEMWDHPEWIEEYIEDEGKKLTDEEKDILWSWRYDSVGGQFVVMRHMKNYSVFMPLSGQMKLYAVLGLTGSIKALMGRRHLPCGVNTVLLPFRGKIIYDSVLEVSEAVFTDELVQIAENTYNEIKTVSRIIETIGGDPYRRTGSIARDPTDQ